MKEIDAKSSPARRKLLKSLAASGGAVVAAKSIPGQWIEPVVDSVLLPRQARTTPTRSGTYPRPGQ